MKLALAVGALAASGTLVALTTPAQADPPDHAQARGVVAYETGADTKAERRAVRTYWTAKRMRNAIPRDAVRPGAKPSGNAKPTKPGGGSKDPSLGSVWTSQQKTIGKVFFTLGGSNYVCSGNAVDHVADRIDSPDVVSTAGHCVSDGVGKHASFFAFVPSYDPTKAMTAQPNFVASDFFTTEQWDAQGSDKWDYDVAFAKVSGYGGQTLEQYVGGSGTDIAFSPTEPGAALTDYGLTVHAFGYPAARPYDGTKLVSCWGTTTDDYVGGSGDYRLRCNMTGGSSGGPWLRDPIFSGTADNSNNVQVSVNSFGYQGEKNAMYGPVFGPTVKAVYEAAR